MTKETNRAYHGWTIVSIAALTLCVTNGLTLAGLTVFDEPLLQNFGWSRGELKLRDLVTFATAGLLGPIAGSLVDRFGAKLILAAGTALMAVGLFCYPFVLNLKHLYFIHFLFGISLAFAGIVTTVSLVTRWFTVKRGLALGITLVGTSLGNMIFPVVNQAALSSFQWQFALQIAAIFPLTMTFVILFLARDRKQDSTSPSGAISPESKSTRLHNVRSDDRSATLGQALKTSAFWWVALIAMVSFYTILGLSSHLFCT